MQHTDVLIVGAGHSGVALVAELVQQGFPGTVLLVNEEEVTPYHRPPLSKAWLSGLVPFEDITLQIERFASHEGLTILTGTSVVRLEPSTHEVVTSTGDRWSFGIAVIATGAAARSLPGLREEHNPHVHRMRDLADAVVLKERMQSGGSLGIVGAGLVGLEVAATARRLGCRTHIFARSDRILGRSVSAPIAAHLQSRHESEGVRFTFGAEPLGVVPGDGGPVLVTGGEHHRFDDILVAVGSEPRDLLAVRAGIETAQGVLVDERRRTSVADVYCIGDAARLRRPTNGTPDRLESVHGANDDAKIVAAQILGNGPAAPAVPWFWSDQYDVRLQVAGFRSKSTCAVVRGAEAEDEFAVVHTAGERVVCVEAVNSAVDFAVGRRLIATGARMDLALLATAESLLDAVCEEEPE